LAHGEEGQSMVEFGLAIIPMVVFVVGVMQVCLAAYTHEYISELAREGSRYAAFHGSNCILSSGGSCTVTDTTGSAYGSFPSVDNYVKGIGLPNLGGGSVNVVTTYPGANGEAPGGTPPDTVKVVVTYAFPYNIPLMPKKTLTMSSTSTMTIVQ
jgi:hypothetical protein